MSIKLPESPDSGAPENTDTIRELIPWYVNGTLPEDEVRQVEDAAQADPAIAREISQQRRLAKKVATEDPFDVPLERSWDALRAPALADIAARSPAARPWHRQVLDRIEGRFASAIGAAALACAALVLVVQLQAPGNNDFVTLTAPPDGTELVIKFQPSGRPDIQALIELGILSVQGPSESGVYTALVPKDADITAVVRAMLEREDILFAAPEGDQ
jgi:anti-sigma-K factor RskA